MSTENIQGPSDVATLREALIGRAVVSVKMGSDRKLRDLYGGCGPVGEVLLDDGTVLLIQGNLGGCSCSAGDYELTALNDKPVNGITNVEVRVAHNDEWDEAKTFRIFVLAFDGTEQELAVIDGDDGNGYYGTGFWIDVVSA